MEPFYLFWVLGKEIIGYVFRPVFMEVFYEQRKVFIKVGLWFTTALNNGKFPLQQ